MASNYFIYICEDAIGVPLNKQVDELFWDLKHPELKLLSASLEMEINKAGKLTFQMPYNHPMKSKVHKKKTRFYVARGNTPIWSGRVLDTKKTFYKAIEVTVEGALTYFLDTIQRPYDYGDVEAFVDSLYPTIAPGISPTAIESVLYFIINSHNQECDEDKVFRIRPKDSSQIDFDNNDYVTIKGTYQDEPNLNAKLKKSFKSEEYATSKDELNNEIISKYGGFFICRYDKNTHRNRLIYCLKESGLERGNVQTIEFGKNMLDFVEEVTSENIYTRCIPLGASYGDFEDLRKKAYNKEKKEYNEAIDAYNKQIGQQKKDDRDAAEHRKKAAENACGYTAYKEALEVYQANKYAYDSSSDSTEKPTKPEMSSYSSDGTDNFGSIRNSTTGKFKTLKEYGFDSNSSNYDRVPAEDKMPSWEDSGFAMPTDDDAFDKNTKITINKDVNLWYKSPWAVYYHRVDGKIVDDYVTHSPSDESTYGKITASVDLSVYLPKELPASESKCNAVYSTYRNALKQKAKDWLKKNRLLSTSITVNAIDLAYMTDGISHIDCGYSIPVSSPPHGLTNDGINVLCSACTINLISPGESEYTIGAVFKALTDKSVANKERSGKAYGLARSSYSM